MTRRTPLLTTADVADRLATSRRTVLRYVEAGELIAFRLPGGGLRFDGHQVDVFIRSRRVSRDLTETA
jgi:excisionase family DNA binding protein